MTILKSQQSAKKVKKAENPVPQTLAERAASAISSVMEIKAINNPNRVNPNENMVDGLIAYVIMRKTALTAEIPPSHVTSAQKVLKNKLCLVYGSDR